MKYIFLIFLITSCAHFNKSSDKLTVALYHHDAYKLSINKINGFKILKKTESTPNDKIILLIGGTAYSNFAFEHLFISESVNLYEPHKREISTLSLRGLDKGEHFNHKESSHKFEFPFEVAKKDYWEDSFSKEIRIPLIEKNGHYASESVRIRISYENKKWSVKKLDNLPSEIEFTGTLAKEIHQFKKDGVPLKCDSAAINFAPSCYLSSGSKSHKLSQRAGIEAFERASLIFSLYEPISLWVICEKSTSCKVKRF